jgi:2-polyprenyl-3-methyl-5-hydroxy-6-metoxy-1,4-benzoquinol methylase
MALDLSSFDESAESESFDFITTFDAIHDQAKPLNVLKGIHRALKPEGVYLMQDISGTSHMDRDIEHPIGTFLYAISCMHCMTVSLAQAGRAWVLCGAKRKRASISRAGFRSITTHQLAHDIRTTGTW